MTELRKGDREVGGLRYGVVAKTTNVVISPSWVLNIHLNFEIVQPACLDNVAVFLSNVGTDYLESLGDLERLRILG